MAFKKNISIAEQMRDSLEKYTFKEMVNEKAIEIIIEDTHKAIAKVALDMNLHPERISELTNLTLEQVEALRSEVTA